jgi:glutamate racemase
MSESLSADAHSSIGLFDSGVGGLTILQEVVRLLPHENCIYFGDTARFPYGNKSPETIVQFAKENTHFLLSKNIKLLVIPCYTACAHAYISLKSSLPIPVIGVIELGIQQLARASQTNCVAILGTTSTIESGSLQSQLLTLNPLLQIHAIACPLFAPFAEEGLQDHPALKKIAKHYLSHLRNTNIDCALLACTHYPLLSTTIQEVLGPHVQLFSPAQLCAEQILDTLNKKNILGPNIENPTYRFYVSANPKKFNRLAQNFLTIPIEKIELAQNKTL